MSIAGVLGGLKYMPASLGIKALQKVNPKFKNYFANASAYGVDAKRALDYITDRFESDSQRDYKQQLEKGAAQNTLRPDEQVSRSNIRNAEMPMNIAKGLGAIGIGGAIGGLGGAASQAAGQLAGQGQEGAQMEQQQQQQQPQDPFAFLAQYSPDLASTIQQYIQSGQSPEAAGAIVKNSKGFQSLISKIEKDIKMNFVDFMKQMFAGQGAQGVQEQPPQQQAQQGQQGSLISGLTDAIANLTQIQQARRR